MWGGEQSNGKKKTQQCEEENKAIQARKQSNAKQHEEESPTM